MTNYLFLFSISPVQSFISQARKTKDLYAGSFLLSYLCKIAIEEFKNKNGNIIFPVVSNNISVPNMFLGKLGKMECNDINIKDIGKSIENKITVILKELGNKLEKNVKNITKVSICPELSKSIQQQLESIFDFFWIFYPLKSDYKESFLTTIQNHNALKNLRKFNQLEEEGARKCSICGERNALFYGGKKKKFMIACAVKVSEIAEDEALCTVCYLKRILDKIDSNSKFKEIKIERNFPSVAKITLLDWLKDVDYDELKKKDGFDEEWFLEDKKHEEIINFIKERRLDVKKQKKYYALIRIDVDDLGKWLSGKKKNTENLEDLQKDLSEKLNNFSIKVNESINKKGKIIYAGGDDFLGFINLYYLFEFIKEVKKEFLDNVESEYPELTYSTSLIVTHYRTPLHKVLEYSKNLMDETKEFFPDKNGLGIIVMNTSSITAKTICKYDDFILLKEMLDKKVGYNFFFKLGREFPFLNDIYTFDEFLLNKEMLITETKRLFKRESTYNKDITSKLINFIQKQNIEHGRNAESIDFENFIGFLKTLEQLRKVMKWDT